MLERNLEFLICPQSGTSATAVTGAGVKRLNGVDHIWNGSVSFGGGTSYPVTEGILSFGTYPNQALYDKMWESDYAKQSAGEATYGDQRHEKLLTRLGNKTLGWLEGKKFLDVGIGLGRFSHAAVELGADVIGLDSSLVSLQRTRSRLAETLSSDEFSRCDFVQANLLTNIFQPRSFDVVFSSYVLHHTEHTGQAIRIIGKYVRRNGHLAVTVFRDGTFPPLMWWMRDALSALSEEVRIRSLAKVGILKMASVERVIDFPRIFADIESDPDLKAVSDAVCLKMLVHRENAATPYTWVQSREELRRWF